MLFFAPPSPSLCLSSSVDFCYYLITNGMFSWRSPPSSSSICKGRKSCRVHFYLRQRSQNVIVLQFHSICSMTKKWVCLTFLFFSSSPTSFSAPLRCHLTISTSLTYVSRPTRGWYFLGIGHRRRLTNEAKSQQASSSRGRVNSIKRSNLMKSFSNREQATS